MGTWRLLLFLLTVRNCNMTSTPSSDSNLFIGKSSIQPTYSTTSSFGCLFSTIITTRAVVTDRASFTNITISPKRASNTVSSSSKIRLSGGGKEDCNDSVVSKVIKNGEDVANNASILNVKGNFTVLPNSSGSYLSNTTVEKRNVTDGNNTSIQIMRNSTRNMDCQDTEAAVYITVRYGIFFGGIFFILLVGIGIYRARTRCRPKKYEDPLLI